jgi:hypothetical protein
MELLTKLWFEYKNPAVYRTKVVQVNQKITADALRGSSPALYRRGMPTKSNCTLDEASLSLLQNPNLVRYTFPKKKMVFAVAFPKSVTAYLSGGKRVDSSALLLELLVLLLVFHRTDT